MPTRSCRRRRRRSSRCLSDEGLDDLGGNALNVAVHWRRAGGSARYFGAIGSDNQGAVILEELEKVGLSSEDVERRSGDTAITLLRDDDGDRKFLLEALGVGRDYMPGGDHYRIIAAADWVHLGTNANADLIQRLVADRVSFSVDVSTVHRALPLEGVPLVFASGPDEADQPVEPLVTALKGSGARQVVVTCGSRGAYFSDGGALLHAPATPVLVVDTCGAGDSFIAVFLAAFCCEKRGPAESLHRATAGAAQTCLYIGGFPQTPRRIPDWLLAKYDEFITPAEGS